MLAVGFPAVISLQFGISGSVEGLSNLKTRGSCLLGSNSRSASMNLKTRGSSNPWSVSMKQNSWSTDRLLYKLPCKCKSSLDTDFVDSTLNVALSFKNWQGSIGIAKLALAGGLTIFMSGGLEPVVHLSRSLYWNKSDDQGNWTLEPFFLWVGTFLLCRALDPIFPATEAGKIVKLLLKFVKSVSATLASDYCLLSLNLGLKYQRKYGAVDTRNTGLAFVTKVVHTVLCVIATLSLIELLGFSHPKLAMGRVLVLVLLMQVVNEGFAKSRPISMQVHATGRPHVANEEIKTESEGYGTINALTSEEEGKAHTELKL